MMEEYGDRIVDVVQQFNDDYALGGYIDMNNLNTRKQIIQPDVLFKIDLHNICDKMPQHINADDVHIISNNVAKINLQLYKNPACIVIAYIVCKLSSDNKINPTVLKSVYNNDEVVKFVKEYQLSQADVVRYCRHLLLFVPEMVVNS